MSRRRRDAGRVRMDDLGGRLLRADLVSEDQVIAAEQAGGARAAALVDAGVDEDMLLDFLSAEGHAHAAPERILEPFPDALNSISGDMAVRLLVLPLEFTDEGLRVAMADPGDPHALREVALASGSLVEGVLSKVSTLRAAVTHAYPDAAAASQHPQRDSGADIAFELTRDESPSDSGAWGAPAGKRSLSTMDIRRPKKRFSRPPGAAKLRASDLPPAPPPTPPLPSDAGGSAQNSGKYVPKPPSKIIPQASAGLTSKGGPKPKPNPPTIPSPPLDPLSDESSSGIEIELSDTWDVLEVVGSGEFTPPPEVMEATSTAAIAAQRIRRPMPTEVRPPGDVGTTVARMRTLRDRDAALDLAFESAVQVARSVVFLTLRDNVLRGWSGKGGSLTPDSVRNIWIPISTPSMFRAVVTHGTPHVGRYGTSAADNLFRAATGSRGGTVVAAPVEVMGKTVAVFVADDVRYDELGQERIQTLAAAVGDALKRIILARKKD